MSIYSTDRELLQTAIDWLEKGHKVALTTVAKTWGSSPRPRGSMLLIRDDGHHAGSVSGGCVEEDIIQRYKSGQLSEQYPTLINYGVNRQEALRFGLPCGGRLELVVEQLETATPVKALLDKIIQGELVARRLCMNTGEASLHNASRVPDFEYNQDELIKVFGPGWQLFLIGAGHLSRYVANIALMLDYRVVVCDPREEYQAGWDVEGTQFSRQMPDDLVRGIIEKQRTIVVTLSHDPKLDDMALMEALTENLFYVGALGSRRSNDQRRQRLSELGVSKEQLKKLHAPVGLDIGSHTPPEIAVSIMAEITAARNQALHDGNERS